MIKKQISHINANKQRKLLRSKGFTIVELLTVVAIIGILALITYPTYQHFVGKAKITVAGTTLNNIRSTLLFTVADGNKSYPTTIDFTTGLDNLGNVLLQQPLLDQINHDLFLPSITYVADQDSFTITAQANDANHTVLIVTDTTLITQGN